jgi:leader peptidase (prepilin peptidase)/N-methyltransferase
VDVARPCAKSIAAQAGLTPTVVVKEEMQMNSVRPRARFRLDAVGIAGIAAVLILVTCWWRDPFILVTSLAIALVAVDVARVDLATRRVPNRHVIAVSAIVAAGAVAGWLSGSSPWTPLLGGLVAGGPVLLFHLVSPGGMGFGDVKWATALGGAVGLVCWPAGVLVPLVGSVVALVMAATTRQRLIPFAPGLSIGALVAVTAGLSGALR